VARRVGVTLAPILGPGCEEILSTYGTTLALLASALPAQSLRRLRTFEVIDMLIAGQLPRMTQVAARLGRREWCGRAGRAGPDRLQLIGPPAHLPPAAPVLLASTPPACPSSPRGARCRRRRRSSGSTAPGGAGGDGARNARAQTGRAAARPVTTRPAAVRRCCSTTPRQEARPAAWPCPRRQRRRPGRHRSRRLSARARRWPGPRIDNDTPGAGALQGCLSQKTLYFARGRCNSGRSACFLPRCVPSWESTTRS
jgi:hypothetical protein